MIEPAFILSFDVEEHHRIEAAAGLDTPAATKAEYARRMEATTRLLLDTLAGAGAKATFYVVGEIAHTHPALVRDIAAAGHEVGSHGWDHQRVHRFTPETFAADLQQSIAALEDASGVRVRGYRAPTFSVMGTTAWAAGVLAQSGLDYDTSIFPVRHDRYGVPEAPRTPFVLASDAGSILELPPATWRVAGQNLPVAGGGYFRLFPPAVMRAGLRQLATSTAPPVGMLYFHPWEFDPGQPELPLKRLSKFRTYVGIRRSLGRLKALLGQYRFRRAADVVDDLLPLRDRLPMFHFAAAPSVRGCENAVRTA
jgi:polysaccharide deacetylase family protein (PEP-CTERM system associated)